jgi:integrase
MKIDITQDVIRKLPNVNRDLYDAKYPGLVLRCRASGKHSWRIVLGRGDVETLGSLKALTPKMARELAQAAKGKKANAAIVDKLDGKDPKVERRRRRAAARAIKHAATLDQFLSEQFDPWALAHLKTGAETGDRVRTVFAEFLPKALPEITPFAVERWRSARHRDDIAPTTTNRDLDCLRSVLSKAVEWGILSAHPLRPVKRAKVDAIGRLRYLSADEEKHLRAALTAREQGRRNARANFNRWRTERGYTPIPDYPPDGYTDHLQPIVLLALGTGLRRGELLALRWSDVDSVGSWLTVRGTSAKTGRTRHVPLNTDVRAVLARWRPADATDDDLVFPGPKGEPMQDLKTAWLKVAKAARLKGFTFHDLRHTFASKLVQAGVDLNTTRELLGHSGIAMTLRYAHLAPEHKAQAVAKLVTAK